MVIFFEWHQTAMDQKTRSGLPMTGEDTGLEALASPLAGYLGKVQERVASLEYCPWCTSKGLTYALRSYRINLQDSITLCTNPQCLFPLVSRSLEDVLASLDPVEPTVGNKRRNALALEEEEFIKPACKRLRSSELHSPEPQSITVDRAAHGAVNGVGNGQRAEPKPEDGRVNGYHRDSTQDEEVLDKEPETAVCTGAFSPPTCSASAGDLQSSSDALLVTDGDDPALSCHCISEAEDDLRQVKSPEVLNKHCRPDTGQSSFTNEDICSPEIDTPPHRNERAARTTQKTLAAVVTPRKDMGGIDPGDSSCPTVTTTEELVPVPTHLFWTNSDNLCWLDSLLVALVNCKSLRKCKPEDEPQRSSVWRLIREYEDICAAIETHQQPGRDGVVMVPNRVLQKADADLQSLRMTVFKLLQPKLQCKLGQKETPVFALPLLLTMDSWVEPLFQTTFHWEFKCSECKAATKERVMKTLPTFPKTLSDWHPLRAVHSAPCNVCRKKNQRRTMTLESVPPVFELHFVNGLPDNDVRNYAFTFEGKRHSITTVIQYNQQLEHFVTWICNSDGSWLEYDDLKANCKTHHKLPVPAKEIHVVFWEVEEDKDPPACTPSSTLAESPTCKNETDTNPADKDLMTDEPSPHTPDHSLLMCHDDTAIVRALSASEDDKNVMDTTAGADTSIGSTTLLDTFEGLTHNDIITLTLVEMDSDIQPVRDNGQAPNLGVPSSNEILDSTPDSSSTPIGSEMSPTLHVELPSNSTASEPEDDSSSDPTFVPAARAGRRKGRGKLPSRQTGKKAASSKAAPRIPPPASSEPSKEISSNAASAAAAQDNAPPGEMTPQTSPVSSADIPPLSGSHQSLTMLPAPLQNSRWSFLLSKHPLHRVHKAAAKPAAAPVAPVKLGPPTHSTPNPVKRQQISGGSFPKPQLKTEESEGLPLKAAEMYDAFGAKSSSPLLPPHEFLNGKSKLFQPTAANHQKLLTNTTMVSAKSLPTPKATGLLEISKKRGSQPSKVPPGLSDTEALRYKLIKKLKAKKKKLAKLNEMLGHQGGASLHPDSTHLGSPNTVTSSTYDGSISDDFLSDLLSPATTASNLSPDSTGFLEMLATGPDGADQSERGSAAASQADTRTNEPCAENFLDDFLSQAVAQRPTEMETEALSALELFV